MEYYYEFVDTLFLFKENFEQLWFAQLIGAFQAFRFLIPIDQSRNDAEMCIPIRSEWIFHVFPTEKRCKKYSRNHLGSNFISEFELT